MRESPEDDLWPRCQRSRVHGSAFNVQNVQRSTHHNLASSPTRAHPFREGYRKGKMEVGETRERETQQHLFTVLLCQSPIVRHAPHASLAPGVHSHATLPSNEECGLASCRLAAPISDAADTDADTAEGTGPTRTFTA
ncbi:hypothetical protein BJ912DRAFT_922397 [Pholiota molesta]|nr:hypothetical protein BJ912DRAFT_922397 [Pholiota molesta]